MGWPGISPCRKKRAWDEPDNLLDGGTALINVLHSEIGNGCRLLKVEALEGEEGFRLWMEKDS